MILYKPFRLVQSQADFFPRCCSSKAERSKCVYLLPLMFANILQQEQTSFGLNTASPLMRGKSHVSQALQLKNPPLSQVLQMCCALTKYLTLHTHTPMHAHIKHTHIRTERFSNMPLNGTTKYGLWFHKSCRWRSYVLPVPATGDKSAPVCAFSTD